MFIWKSKIPLDKSNATFDNTLSSTFENAEVSSNSTKVDESIAYDDNDDAEVESDTKDEPAETTANDNDVVTESTEINNSNNMVNKQTNNPLPILSRELYLKFDSLIGQFHRIIMIVSLMMLLHRNHRQVRQTWSHCHRPLKKKRKRRRSWRK